MMKYILLLTAFTALIAGVMSKPAASGEATILIDNSKLAHVVDAEYISFNFDWWPDSFVYPAWYHSSVNNMSLTDNPDLVYLASNLGPAHLRIGGSRGDVVVYQTPQHPICAEVPTPGNFCLTMDRWTEINKFAQMTGSTIAFGLNAMNGRKSADSRMDLTNVREFLQWTSEQNFTNLWGFEFGNELNLGKTWPADPAPYAEDLIAVKGYIDTFWKDRSPEHRPKLVANDEVPDAKYWNEFLPLVDTNTILAATWHLYIGFGGDSNLPNLAFNRTWIGRVDTMSAPQITAAAEFMSKGGQLWMGETAMAYGSGRNFTTNTFLSGPWWIYQLGTLAYTHTVQCRQTLKGGYYELIDKYSMQPNPDYYTALLWKRTMGRGVLHTKTDNDDIAAFAHCGHISGVSIAFVNFSPDTEYTLSVSGLTEGDLLPREEYHLSAVGSEDAQLIALNGETLWYKDQKLAPLNPVEVTDPSTPLVVKPHTYGFINFPKARCVSRD